MIPTHRDGLAAAKRVAAANDDGHMPDARDAVVMTTYHLSLVLRQIPEKERLAAARLATAQIMANTRESLD